MGLPATATATCHCRLEADLADVSTAFACTHHRLRVEYKNVDTKYKTWRERAGDHAEYTEDYISKVKTFIGL